jgi:CO/xanthine dehydrogenase Mo-binding subunit
MTKPKPKAENRRESQVPHKLAFELYLAQPRPRSLRKLAEQLRELKAEKGWRSTPVLATLGRWSIRHEWQAKLDEHDALVARGLSEKLIRQEVDAKFDQLVALRNIQRGTLGVAVQMLAGALGLSPDEVERVCAGDFKPLRISGQVKELKALVQVGAQATELVELLEGRPTSRRSVLEDESEDKLIERLRRKAEQRRAWRDQLAARPDGGAAEGAGPRPQTGDDQLH